MTSDQQTILLADDAPTNLKMIAHLLENNGFELVVALNGHEALERAELVRPDLILLDVMMPDLDGFEVCRRLKEHPDTADIPVIFMTALSAQQNKLDGFSAGAVDYLTKPLQLDEVLARVKVHLKLRALQQQLAARNNELRRHGELLRALIGRQEAEHEAARRQMAHKIHEDLAQILASLPLYATALGSGQRHDEAFSGMTTGIERAIKLSREMVAMLRPTVLDLGVSASLRWLARDFQKGLGLSFVMDIKEDVVLDDRSTTFLFRAAQELLVNIALHAAATKVWLSFATEENRCHLTIGDDGCGFDPCAPRKDNAFGHSRLAEQTSRHGGTLFMDSASGRGTRVKITLPLPANACQRSADSAS